MSIICSPNRARFQILCWDASMRAPSTVRRYELGVYGRTPKEIHRRSKRYISHYMFFRSQALTDPTDLSPGGCCWETLDASKHRPPSGRYFGTTSTDL